MGIRFVLYGFAGWCTEVFWTGLGSLISGDLRLRGWTYMWMLPIYGLAVFLEPIHDRIRGLPIILRGGIYTVLIFSVEYITGWLLKLATGACPWDYSGKLLSVSGFIRLDYAPAWFTAGLLFEKLHDLLAHTVIVKNV